MTNRLRILQDSKRPNSSGFWTGPVPQPPPYDPAKVRPKSQAHAHSSRYIGEEAAPQRSGCDERSHPTLYRQTQLTFSTIPLSAGRLSFSRTRALKTSAPPLRHHHSLGRREKREDSNPAGSDSIRSPYPSNALHANLMFRKPLIPPGPISGGKTKKWRSRNQMGNLKYRASTGQTPTAHRQPDDKNVEFR